MSQKLSEKTSPRAHIQVELPDGEQFDAERLLEQLRIEMRSFASGAGLFVMNELMRLEAESLAGTPWQRHTDIDFEPVPPPISIDSPSMRNFRLSPDSSVIRFWGSRPHVESRATQLSMQRRLRLRSRRS